MILCIQQHEQYFAKIRTDKTAVCNGYDRWNDSMAIWQLVTVAKCYHLTRVVSGFRDFTQCAAVKTQFGWTNDPPQNCPPLEVVIIACHGQEFTMASRPPTIRVRGRLPQVPASKNLKKKKRKKTRHLHKSHVSYSLKRSAFKLDKSLFESIWMFSIIVNFWFCLSFPIWIIFSFIVGKLSLNGHVLGKGNYICMTHLPPT